MKIIEEVGLSKVIKFLGYSLFEIVYDLMILSPLKVVILNLVGAGVETSAVILKVKFFNWHHLGPKGLEIGKDCFLGDETMIDLYGSVKLEDQVTLAQRVTVLTHQNVGFKNHPLQKYFPKKSAGVIFKKGCVVGACAVILPGVTIGEKSFVAAGSVVTKNVSPLTLVAGVPAVVKKILK